MNYMKAEILQNDNLEKKIYINNFFIFINNFYINSVYYIYNYLSIK